MSDLIEKRESFGDNNFITNSVLRMKWTTDLSSNDESDESKYFSANSSVPPWSIRDRNNNENGQYRMKKNWKLPSIPESTINSDSEDDGVIPKLENLTLDSDCELLTINKIAKLCLNESSGKPLAGVVTAVTKVIGLIVAKPPFPHDILLYLGTPIFVRKSSKSLAPKDVKLGWIIDVFGPACEPYYCVKPLNNGIELVHEGSELFYSTDHPRTVFFRLKRENNNRYTVIYSPRSHLMQNNESDRQDEEHFRSNTSGGRSPNRKLYRRRYENNNWGNLAYGNKKRHDPYAYQSMQPKHSYFDF